MLSVMMTARGFFIKGGDMKRQLSASEVAKVYGIDRHSVVRECEVYIASRGRRGIRCSRIGRTWRIRPECMDDWIVRMEDETCATR